MDDNIEMDPQEIMCEDVKWIHLLQDKLQWKILMNFGYKAGGNGLSILATISVSRLTAKCR